MRVSQMQDEGVQADHHSALAKAFVTARMRETVALCREVMGGNGIQLDHGVALLRRRRSGLHLRGHA